MSVRENDFLHLQALASDTRQTSDSSTQARPNQTSQDRIEPPGEAPDTLDCYDYLSKDLGLNFAEWFCGDMSKLRPGTGRKERSVSPMRPLDCEANISQANLEFGDDLKYLTEEQEESQREPASLSILKTSSINIDDTNMRRDTRSTDGDKVLTLILKSQSILVDRRSLQKKKQKTTHPQEEKTTSDSCIAPGEDCDESANEDERENTDK